MDTFYNTRELSVEQKTNLLTRALALCDNWWVDILDCSKSVAREKIEMSFEGILSKLSDKCHFIVIHRKGSPMRGEEYLEIGFSTIISGPDYFLWIILDMKHLRTFQNEYELQPR